MAADVSVINQVPQILSVRTYSSYTDDLSNVQDDYFSASGNSTVYVQVKASDGNGFRDIQQNGGIGVKIVLWDSSTETEFTRFGSVYKPASFESGNGKQAIYTYSFPMDVTDATRLGNETSPLFYRVKAQVSDGELVTTSDVSPGQNADYNYNGTYYETPVGPYSPPTTRPPFPVMFDISITIPDNKRMVVPGDSFYATVAVNKISPPGQIDAYMTYKIINPENVTVAYLAEVVAVNYSLYRVPVLYLPTDAQNGQYTFRASVSYDGIDSWSEAAFEVNGPPATTTTLPGNATTTSGGPTTTNGLATTTTGSEATSTTSNGNHGGGGGIGGGFTFPEIPLIPAPETKKAEVTIDKYPSEVYGFNGDSKPLMTVIENTGDTTLSDITVYLGGPTPVQNIIPEKIEVMESGDRKIFILNIKIPDKMKPGEYDMVLKAITGQATDEKHMKLIVLEKPDAPEVAVKARIDELTNIVDSVWSETVGLGVSSEDKDVTEIFKSLGDAKGMLDIARDDWNNKRYLQAEQALDSVRKQIEDSVLKLTSIKSQRNTQIKEVVNTKEVTIYTLPPTFWAIAIIAVLVTTLFTYERIRSSKPGKKIEEMYDLWRTKDLILGRSSGDAGRDRTKEPVEKPK